MVIPAFIHCDSCQAKFKLKLQMDYSIDLYDWPIALVCPDCGNIIKCSYGKGGLSPKSLSFDPQDDDELYLVGYSSQLPISPTIFYKKMKNRSTMGTLTPFMSLYFHDEQIKMHELNMNMLIKNVLPWRNFLSDLLPIYVHGNVGAFIQKIKNIFEVDPEGLNNIEDCELRIIQQLGAIYTNLTSFNYYKSTSSRKCFAMIKFLKGAPPEFLDSIKNAVDIAMNVDEWLKEEGFDFIARIVSSIEKLAPAMLYASRNQFITPHQESLYIATIDYKEVDELYQRGSESLDHILPLIAAILNLMKWDNPDNFGNSKMKGVNSIADFAKLPMGLKLDKLSDYEEMIDYIFGSLNSHIRNGIAHRGDRYNSKTQIVSYYYDKDPTVHYDEQLLDVTFRCYLLLVKLLEAVHLYSLVKYDNLRS